MVFASVRFMAPRVRDRICSLEPPGARASWSKSVPSVVILVIVLIVSDMHTILLSWRVLKTGPRPGKLKSKVDPSISLTDLRWAAKPMTIV